MEKMIIDTESKCPECHGRGFIHCHCWPGDCICDFGDEICAVCNGEGWVDDYGYHEDMRDD